MRLAGTLRLTLLGALICVIILFYPGGLMQAIAQVGAWSGKIFRRRSAS